MSNQIFIKETNISTLWDVITDEDIFKFLTRDNQNNVLKLFNDNIKLFFDAEKIKQTNLIDMNKKYILLILNYIRKNFPNNMPNKIKIYQDSETKEAITYEEIKNERKSQFEMDFVKRQEEFTKAMSLDIPKIPEFKDNFIDEPINKMEEMIKEMTTKRNYDIEQVNRSYQQNNDQWLKPQDTSIKNEKFLLSSQNQNQREKDKNVSWGKNEVFLEKDQGQDPEGERNIFKKLKKISNVENTNYIINEYENNNNLEERLIKIEEKLGIYTEKIDKILNILEK
jgi:hypothetical protein